MKCTEINPKGNFDCWEDLKIRELKNEEISESLGQKLLFENENIKIWEAVLFPGKNFPFRKISENYNFTSMTDGLAISRNANGKIALVRLKKGEPIFMSHNGVESIYDFENVGDNILFIHAMEFRPLIESLETQDLTSF